MGGGGETSLGGNGGVGLGGKGGGLPAGRDENEVEIGT